MHAGSPDRVERRLAAILVADVAGYSRLIRADEGDVGPAQGVARQRAHFAMANVLRAQRRYAEAISEFEAALTFDRNLIAALAILVDSKSSSAL